MNKKHLNYVYFVCFNRGKENPKEDEIGSESKSKSKKFSILPVTRFQNFTSRSRALIEMTAYFSESRALIGMTAGFSEFLKQSRNLSLVNAIH